MKNLILQATFLIAMLNGACSKSESANGKPQEVTAAESTRKEFLLSECPVLAGDFQEGNNVMTIYETRDANSYKVILGQGATPILVDGNLHQMENGSASYQAWCERQVLKIQIQSGTNIGVLKYYFSSAKILMEEGSGIETYNRQWLKK